MAIAFLALGSNKTAWAAGRARSPAQVLQAAVAALDAAEHIWVLAASGVYRTAALGPGRQRPYVNAVVAVETALSAKGLLDALHNIEHISGRVRRRAWQARPLDLDVIDYDGAVLPSGMEWRNKRQLPWPNRLAARSAFLKSRQSLTLPHPRAHQRSFVLKPLAEMCPGWQHPALGLHVEALQRQVMSGPMRRLGPLIVWADS